MARCAACLVLFFVLGIPALSQLENGQFTGVVTDPTGAVISGARVRVLNLDNGIEFVFRSNEAGLYYASGLLTGRYRLRSQAKGFADLSTATLALSAGTSVRVDLHMKTAEARETIQVITSPASVNTQDGRLSAIVDQEQIANLPLNGRNVYDLVQYAPGAVNVRHIILESGANTVVNGVRENFNGFLLNGVANTGLSGGPVNQPIQDTVEEFQVLTLNNSAEFGNNAGAITSVVTRSGTNFLHGSAWEFVRNNAFDANSYFANNDPNPANRKQSPLHLNQFGGTIGGPIVRNKLFFFAAYQGDRFITSSPGEVLVESPQFRQAVEASFPGSVASLLYSSFPADSGRPAYTLQQYVKGNYSGSGFTSFAQYLCPGNTDQTGVLAAKFARLFGVQQADIDQMNQGGCPGGSPFSAPQAGVFQRNQPFLVNALDPFSSQTSDDLFNGNEASLRIDYDPNAENRFFAEFNWAKSRDNFAFGENVAPRHNFLSPFTNTTPNFQFSFIRVFSPITVNEFRAGYTSDLNLVPVSLPGVPNIALDDGTVGFGSYSGYPQYFREHTYSYSDLVSLSRGKHLIKIGGDVRRNLQHSESNEGRPSYSFFDPLFFALDAPYGEGAGVDPGLLNGAPSHLATNIRHFRNWTFGLYAQDDWRFSRRLTLNLGLRYDLYARLTDANNLATTFVKGPGQSIIDNITTGAGQIQNASTPCPGNPRAVLAGVCGPGGFAPASSLGAGNHLDLGPRLGFAYDLFGDGKTALRGGFGMAYQGAIYTPMSDTRWNPPYYSLNQAFNYLIFSGTTQQIVYGPAAGGPPTFLGPAPQGQNAGFGVQATGNISGWDSANANLAGLTGIIFPQGIRDPLVRNWFLGVQREIRPKLIMEVNYVGTAANDLIHAESVNRIPGALLPEGTCVTDTFGRQLCSKFNTNLTPDGFPINPQGLLNPNYGNLRVWSNVGKSSYHGLQVSVRRRLRAGWQVSGNYTFSHSIDNGSGWHQRATTDNGFASGDGYTTDQTMPGLDRGNSTFDMRHRATFNYIWALPFFRHNRGLTGVVLGEWQLNGIWSFQSGSHWTPFNQNRAFLQPTAPGACDSATFDPTHCINTGGDYNLDGINNDRPNATAETLHFNHDEWTNGFNLPNNFFTAPCLGCVGNLGRNTFIGPGYWDADMSIFKNFSVSERCKLQFRAEAFNLFNHTNFYLGSNDISNPQFGQAGGTANPRNLQFALKLAF